MTELSFNVDIDQKQLTKVVTENLTQDQILEVIMLVEERIGSGIFAEELLKRAILCCKRHYSHDHELFHEVCNELIEEV
jgi:hypothetical protein